VHKWDEVTGGWSKLHTEGISVMYCSTNIVQVIKSRMRWAVHVAYMGGEERCMQGLGRES